MTRTEAALEPRRAAETLEAMTAAPKERARAAFDELRRRAMETRSKAKVRARAEIHRGRDAAALGLENLADALRPAQGARTRRRAAVIGGSGLALAAAVGLGVALGMMLSKRLRRRATAQERPGPSTGPLGSRSQGGASPDPATAATSATTGPDL